MEDQVKNGNVTLNHLTRGSNALDGHSGLALQVTGLRTRSGGEVFVFLETLYLIFVWKHTVVRIIMALQSQADTKWVPCLTSPPSASSLPSRLPTSLATDLSVWSLRQPLAQELKGGAQNLPWTSAGWRSTSMTTTSSTPTHSSTTPWSTRSQR